MSDLSVTYNASGPVPLTAGELRARIVATATELAPGITTELPGSLIEDVVSTNVGALLVCDQARVDLINSVGPLTANLFMLNTLAQQYGASARKSEGVTSVPVVFSGPTGFVIPLGFLVSDGTYQYALQDATIIPSSGTTQPAICNATTGGAWAVPVGTVNNISTSLPSGILLSCTNLTAGVPAGEPESVADFRARVWETGMSTVQGYPGFIRTKLADVDSVIPRLVSVVEVDNHWVIMCGGGDPHAVAGAIYQSAGDISRIRGSTLNVTGITNAAMGVVTTDLTHGFSSGQEVRIMGVSGISGINDTSFTIDVLSPHSFSINMNTTGSGVWTGGGEVTPNLRNNTVTINDWPDNYTIPYVVPLQQLVTVNYYWKTRGINYLTDATVASLVTQPTIQYVNGIFSGKPLNINSLKNTFLRSVDSVLNKDLISLLTITVTVNGTITDVDENTDIISGDRFSYWYIPDDGVTVTGG